MAAQINPVGPDEPGEFAGDGGGGALAVAGEVAVAAIGRLIRADLIVIDNIGMHGETEVAGQVRQAKLDATILGVEPLVSLRVLAQFRRPRVRKPLTITTCLSLRA